MSDESNLLKLVADLGSKIDAAKAKILAGEQEGDKWKSHLLEAQKALSERKLQLLKLRVKLSGEKEQLAEKEESFNSCLTEVQSDLARLTSSRSWVAQCRLQLDSVREQHKRLTQLMQQHASASQRAAQLTEPAKQLTEQQQLLRQLQTERARLEAALGSGAALRAARQRTAAAGRSREQLRSRLEQRAREDGEQRAAARQLQHQLEVKQAELDAEQERAGRKLARVRSEQSLENERLRALELRAAQLRSQLDGQ